MSKRHSLRIALACVLMAVLLPPTALAQPSDVMEEIVVTATQRERSVQDIPVSVNLVTDTQLERAGVSDIEGLNNLAPSFYLTSTTSESGGTTARIRGVGTQGNNPGLESAVGVFVDGVYRNRSGVALTDLGQIQRIEVLRGPQGTLFGRNTSAGMLNIFTKEPPLYENTGYLELTAGNYNQGKVNAGYSAGGETMAAGIDVTAHTRDGYFDDQITDEEYNSRDRWGARAQLIAEPNDDLSMRFIADAASRDESCCVGVYTLKGIRTTVALENVNPRVDTSDASDPFARESYTDEGRDYDAEVDEWGVSGQVDWTVEDVKLTSITSYRDWESRNAGDLDYSSVDVLYRDTDDLVQNFETFTQEFRLNGQAGDVDWLVGLYYSREDLYTVQATKLGADYSEFSGNLIGLSIDAAQDNPLGTTSFPIAGLGMGSAAGDGANDDFEVISDSYALFTHNTWAVSQDWELTAGLRATREEKDLDANVATTGDACANTLAFTGFAGDGSPIDPVSPTVTVPLATGLLSLNCLAGVANSTLDGSYSDSRDHDEVSGTVSASYYINPEWMGFVSYSRGYKAGGYNLDRAGLDNNTVLGAPGTFGIDTNVNNLEFAEETVDAYELGAKATLGGGTTTLNMTYFYQDFENFQLNTFNGLAFFVVNLNEAISQGVEVDLNTDITDSLSLQGGLVYNEAEYADDLTRSDGGDTSNLAGQTLTHAPEWSATGAIDYEYDLENLTGFLHLGFRWMDEHNTGSDLDPEKTQDAFAILNGRVGIGSENATWMAELWVKNLTDEEYYQVVFDSPVQNTAGEQAAESYSAFLGDPRTWGASINYNF